MKTTALILSLIVGTSSVALARPAAPVVRDHRVNQPAVTIDRDEGRWHRDDDRFAPRSSWEAITGTALLSRGSQTFTSFDYSGRMTRVRVDLMSGTANIRQLAIRFANGQVQTVNVGRLASGRAAFDIDLTSYARIQSITVTGRGNGSYRLLGL